jgi:hypothetical protein
MEQLEKWRRASIVVLFFSVSLPKFINPSGRINNFLFSCVKRVACRTNLDAEIIAYG